MRRLTALPGAAREPLAVSPWLFGETETGRYSWRHFVLAPVLLIATTLGVFRLAVPLGGEHVGQLIGFAFYWILGGIVLPIVLIGRDGYTAIFARRRLQWSASLGAAMVLLFVPVAFGFLFVFPSLFPMDSNLVLAGLAGYAIVNGTLEEVFWRGVFLRRFPSSVWLGVVYPAVLFGIWQLVPWSVFPNWLHIPALWVLAVSVPVGLLYNWIAWRTGTIRWTALAHVLTNLSGLGALLVFSPAG